MDKLKAIEDIYRESEKKNKTLDKRERGKKCERWIE